MTVVDALLSRKLGVAGVGQAEWAAPDGSAQDLTDRLTARCRKKPVVVLVDEAHTLTRDVGQLLLNLSQEVRANAPFLLVAGRDFFPREAVSQSCQRSILSTTPTTISCLPLLSPARLTIWSPEIWRHLLHLKKVQQTRILTARELTELLN